MKLLVLGNIGGALLLLFGEGKIIQLEHKTYKLKIFFQKTESQAVTPYQDLIVTG